MPDFAHRRRELMPAPTELAREAQQKILDLSGGSLKDKAYVAKEFDSLLMRLLTMEYDLFREHQRSASVKILTEYLDGAMDGSPGDLHQASNMEAYVESAFEDLDAFFLGLQQSRRSRAGGSFQRHLAFLFDVLDLPYQEQQVINGTPDFLLPGADLYRSSPADVILITAKRTLRERWRQIIIEGARTPRYFLATIDDGMSVQAMSEMAQNRVVLVVPQEIIERKPEYDQAPNVISYTDLYHQFIVPARGRWPD